MVRKRVPVIITPSTLATIAAKAATTTIPIVFATGYDPVASGLVASLARPGGNLTGVNFLNNELAAKQLDLLRQLVPGATRVAALVNPANFRNSSVALADLEPAARARGLQIQVLNASTAGEIDGAFASFHASGQTPSSSMAMHSSPADGSNWFNRRPSTGSRRHLPIASLPKSAG